MGNSLEYYKLDAEEIYKDVTDTSNPLIHSEVENIQFVVLPHVYPSHKFRTTAFVLKNLKDRIGGKIVCDMGCGPGIVGLYALSNGAKKVIQADINPYAVKNAKKNNELHKFTDEQISTFESNCFDNVPVYKFDIIVFNMPYHCDKIIIDDPLKFAFYDPEFSSIKKFLEQSKNYSHSSTEIFIAFSNKGDTTSLEQIFTMSGYSWELWKITNTDQEYDNRIYRLTSSYSL